LPQHQETEIRKKKSDPDVPVNQQLHLERDSSETIKENISICNQHHERYVVQNLTEMK
jgi:bacterioferritin (cytochrome b1)